MTFPALRLSAIVQRGSRLLGILLVLSGLATSSALAWDVHKASTNLGVPALSSSELVTRKIGLIPMGMLEVPTGEIVASDMLANPDRPALARKIAPGRYPVILYLNQGRPALAVLRIAPGDPVNWEIATTPEQDAATLKDDEIFGYPVDAGTGSFMDKAAYALMREREKREVAKGETNFNYYDVIADEYDVYVMHKPLPGNPINIAVFQSGWGDGYYPSFWGLDAAGKPLMLLTDFQTLENGDARNAYELVNAAALAALSPEQRADVVAAHKAIVDKDIAPLEALLVSGKVKPDSYVEETGFTLTLEAIRNLNAAALETLVRHGAAKEIPAGMLMDITTYPEYSRRVLGFMSSSQPGGKEIQDVIKRWEAGEIPQAK